MKISHNWLKELLPQLALTPEQVAESLTLHSFETVVDSRLAIDSAITVVKIIAIAKHPNADRLQLATVTDGAAEFTVVCGAPNIAVGQVVPYSPPGATVQAADSSSFKVTKATIRGVESPGMLNSLRELGLSASDHAGIWVLPPDTPLGTRLATHVPSDTILEADITPNRAHDCLSQLGIARELAALHNIDVQEPALAALPHTAAGEWQVELADPADSPRYLLATLAGATLGPSPLKLQARLLAVGGKPINSLVDITNYVLFEVGNPTHLFDAEALPGKTLGVRRAREGEKIVALDEKEYTLTLDDLVITGNDQPVAIAGIMGGAATAVSSQTTQLVLEVANFRPYLIQETSRRLALRSESSARFSKGLHPAQAGLAAQRSIELLQSIAGARVTGLTDAYPQAWEPRVIPLRPAQVSRIAGNEIPAAQVREYLTRLRFHVEEAPDTWHVSVPPERLDIDGEHDLVEEVIRVHGLNAIPAATDTAAVPHVLPDWLVLREQVRDALTALGFTETLYYSFEPQRQAELLGLDREPHVTLSNPPAPELKQLRVSLLPGLLAHLAVNRVAFEKNAGRKESALFEIGNVYRPAGTHERTRVPGVAEATHVAGAVVGTHLSAEEIAQAVGDALHVDVATLHTQGSITALAAPVQQKLKYRLPVTVFEFNLSALTVRAEAVPASMPPALAETARQVDVRELVPLSPYPAVFRDLSLLVDSDVSVEHVQSIIERVGGKLLTDVDLFDEYQPPDSDRKGLAFHLQYESHEKTLTNDEVAQLHNRIVAALQEEVAADLR